MIISHSKKFIFFLVSKSGSTTANVLLRMSGAFDLERDSFSRTAEWQLPSLNRPETNIHVHEMGWAHATPKRLIDWGAMTLEQLREYDCYAYLRPVESRFVSGYLHSMRGGAWGREGRAGFQPVQFMERWRANKEHFNPEDLLGRPQVDWFFYKGEQLVQPLDFKNYQSELRKMLDKVGGFQFPEIPRLNRAHQHRVVQNENRREWASRIWTEYEEIQKEMLEWYAKDHEFYVENFGQPE